LIDANHQLIEIININFGQLYLNTKHL